jgi:small-conductance mechanosensitive channel
MVRQQADIGWRSTTIRVLANNLIVIPNSKLSQAIVTNCCLPEKRMSLPIPISVSYDSDPEVIEKILVEEAKMGAEKIPGLLATPEPFLRFTPDLVVLHWILLLYARYLNLWINILLSMS